MSISNVRFNVTISSSPSFPGGAIAVDAPNAAAATLKVRQEAEQRLAAQQGNVAAVEEFLAGF